MIFKYTRVLIIIDPQVIAQTINFLRELHKVGKSDLHLFYGVFAGIIVSAGNGQAIEVMYSQRIHY